MQSESPTRALRAPRHRLPSIAIEAVGIIVAVTVAMTAMSHAVLGVQRRLMLTDGDSLVMPLIQQSLRHGGPQDWAMSPVLFLFPELPLYLLAAAITPTVAGAIILNGIFNVTALYALIRAVLAQVGSRSRLAGVAGSVAGVGLFGLLCALEIHPAGNSGDLGTLFLTSTYYSGTILALMGATALTARILRMPRSRAGLGRRNALPLLGLGVVCGLSTLSNPLFLLWAAAPLLASLTIVAVVRRRRLRAILPTGFVIAAGTAIGYAFRIPLHRFISVDSPAYFHWGDWQPALQFYRLLVDDLALSHRGQIEIALWILAFATCVAGAVFAIVRRAPTRLLFVFVLSVLVPVVDVVVVTLAGAMAARYMSVVLVAPLLGAAVAAQLLIRVLTSRRRPHTVPRRLSSRVGWVAVSFATILVVVGVAVPRGHALVEVAKQPTDPGATCLTKWIGHRDISGVGQYWVSRPLEVYGGPRVHLVQVNPDLTVFPWLVNLAPYRHLHPSYVVTGGVDLWNPSLSRLGRIRSTVTCPGYTITNYAGEPGAVTLSTKTAQSLNQAARAQGDW